jgi:hypothetical protein
MASIDPDYDLVGIIKRRGEKFSLAESDLDSYFVPKRDIDITKEYLEHIGRGVGYTKSGFSYLFKRLE